MVKLENIILSKISQMQKPAYCIINLIKILEKTKFYWQHSTSEVTLGYERKG
jgi:hypothetical protein